MKFNPHYYFTKGMTAAEIWQRACLLRRDGDAEDLLWLIRDMLDHREYKELKKRQNGAMAGAKQRNIITGLAIEQLIICDHDWDVMTAEVLKRAPGWGVKSPKTIQRHLKECRKTIENCAAQYPTPDW